MKTQTLKPAADRNNGWSQLFAGGLVMSQFCILWSAYHLLWGTRLDWRFTAILGTVGLLICLVGQHLVHWHKAGFTPPGLWVTWAGVAILLPAAVAGIRLVGGVGTLLIWIGLAIFVHAYWKAKELL